jgi:ribosomal protein S27E
MLSFESRYIPLSQRMQRLESQIGKIGKMEKDLDAIRDNVGNKVSREAMKKYIEKRIGKSPNKKPIPNDVSKVPSPSEPNQSIPLKSDRLKVKCPSCGRTIKTTGKIGGKTKCSPCSTSLRVKEEYIVD